MLNFSKLAYAPHPAAVLAILLLAVGVVAGLCMICSRLVSHRPVPRYAWFLVAFPFLIAGLAAAQSKVAEALYDRGEREAIERFTAIAETLDTQFRNPSFERVRYSPEHCDAARATVDYAVAGAPLADEWTAADQDRGLDQVEEDLRAAGWTTGRTDKRGYSQLEAVKQGEAVRIGYGPFDQDNPWHDPSRLHIGAFRSTTCVPGGLIPALTG